MVLNWKGWRNVLYWVVQHIPLHPEIEGVREKKRPQVIVIAFEPYPQYFNRFRSTNYELHDVNSWVPERCTSRFASSVFIRNN